jgi:hypothetical protein
MSSSATDAVSNPTREGWARILNHSSELFERRLDYFEARITELEVYMLEAAEAGDHRSVLQVLAFYNPKDQLAKWCLDCCLMDAQYITEVQAKLDTASA